MVLRFLLTMAIIGIVVGLVRHYQFDHPQSNITHEEIVQFHEKMKSDPTVNASDVDSLMNEREIKVENPTKKPSEFININTANEQELLALPNIGPVTAQRIIRYRHEMGLFTKVEDLLNVKGIGPATLRRIKPLITI